MRAPVQHPNALKTLLTSLLIPPWGACRYGCGTNCAAPITVIWLAGIGAIVLGLLGGPFQEAVGISWETLGVGVLLWGVAGLWALLAAIRGATDHCSSASSPFSSSSRSSAGKTGD